MKTKAIFDDGVLVIPADYDSPPTINGQPAQKKAIDTNGKILVTNKTLYGIFLNLGYLTLSPARSHVRRYFPRKRGCVGWCEEVYLRSLPKGEKIMVEFGDPNYCLLTRVSGILHITFNTDMVEFVVFLVDTGETKQPLYLLVEVQSDSPGDEYYIPCMRLVKE